MRKRQRNLAFPTWCSANGVPLTCASKIMTIEQELTDLFVSMQDVFDDALLMEIDSVQIKRYLGYMVQELDLEILESGNQC
jgi:hypothetical protein